MTFLLTGFFGGAVAGATPAATVLLDETIAPLHAVTEADWQARLTKAVASAQAKGLFAAEREKTMAAIKRHAAVPVRQTIPAALVDRITTRQLDEDGTFDTLPEATRMALAGLTRCYALFDGDVWAQRVWAGELANTRGCRAVVINGPVATPTAQLKPATGVSRADPMAGVRVFADQGGRLTRRFGIGAVPALVTLTGLTLTVREVALDYTTAQDDNSGRTTR